MLPHQPACPPRALPRRRPTPFPAVPPALPSSSRVKDAVDRLVATGTQAALGEVRSALVGEVHALGQGNGARGEALVDAVMAGFSRLAMKGPGVMAVPPLLRQPVAAPYAPPPGPIVAPAAPPPDRRPVMALPPSTVGASAAPVPEPPSPPAPTPEHTPPPPPPPAAAAAVEVAGTPATPAPDLPGAGGAAAPAPVGTEVAAGAGAGGPDDDAEGALQPAGEDGDTSAWAPWYVGGYWPTHMPALEVQGEWEAVLDPATHYVFYHNMRTGESVWYPPAEWRQS